jgi:hypothetical protein
MGEAKRRGTFQERRASAPPKVRGLDRRGQRKRLEQTWRVYHPRLGMRSFGQFLTKADKAALGYDED